MRHQTVRGAGTGRCAVPFLSRVTGVACRRAYGRSPRIRPVDLARCVGRRVHIHQIHRRRGGCRRGRGCRAPAMVSSSVNAIGLDEHVTDGSVFIRWESEGSDPRWGQMDPEAPRGSARSCCDGKPLPASPFRRRCPTQVSRGRLRTPRPMATAARRSYSPTARTAATRACTPTSARRRRPLRCSQLGPTHRRRCPSLRRLVPGSLCVTRRSVDNRRATVSERGLRRSCGSVSHYGKMAILAGSR